MQKDSLQNRNGVVKTVAEWGAVETVAQPITVEAPVEEAEEKPKRRRK